MNQIVVTAVTWLALGIVLSVAVGLLCLRPYVRRFLDASERLTPRIGELTDQIEELKDELAAMRAVAEKEIEKREIADLFGPDELKD